MAFIPVIDPNKFIELGNQLLKLRQDVEEGLLDLRKRPVLRAWEITDAHWKCLVGAVAGHPKLGSQKIITSALVAVDSDMKWARTLNTLYRLDPLADGPDPDFDPRLLNGGFGRFDRLRAAGIEDRHPASRRD